MGIAVHLLAELVEFGRGDASVLFSARHQHLWWLTLASALTMAVAVRLGGRPGAAALKASLPFAGEGPGFVTATFAAQLGVYVLTQAAEGEPLGGEVLALGVGAAVLASLAGALALSLCSQRIFEAVGELVWFITRSVERARALRAAFGLRRAERALATRHVLYHFFIPKRPPPHLILARS
jgi:hypothetical protein